MCFEIPFLTARVESQKEKKSLKARNVALLISDGYINDGEVSPLEMFIHVDKISSCINPREARVDARCSVMRE